MRLLSLNVGMPQRVPHGGQEVETGIWKVAVTERRRLAGHQIEGDGQADRRFHGGETKAVYLYPGEHYSFWRNELQIAVLEWGSFGENLTTEGVLEEAVRRGDRFRVGSAEILAVGPREPCFKLALRLDRPDMVERFNASGRCGIYFGVAREGDLGAGDAITLLERDPAQPTIAELFQAKRRTS